ncbi:MAG: hypothetical protein WCR72_01855 [Bacteroidota bacterium]
MKPEHKEYPINMYKPHREMRAKRIKDKFIKSGIFRDMGQFDCGDHIEFEMEMDLRAMKLAIHMIRDYMGDYLNDDDVQVETMTIKEMSLLGAIITLRERINVTGDDTNRYESTKK